MTFDCDLFVIGGGSGGVRAARIAAEHGGSVALAEESRMGGTCVIRGCVPKKLMVFASGYPEAVAEAQAYGWDARIGAFDWPSFRTRLHAELDRLEGVYRRNLDKAGVRIHDTRATIVDPHTVSLATGEVVRARHILVATGGRPVRPDLPGADLGLVSDDMFDLKTLPKRLLIVGGGYIGCEFACIMQGLGVHVSLYYRGEQILRGFDDEARGLVAEAMIGRGIDIRCGTDLTSLEKAGDGLRVHLIDGAAEDFDAVLFATGRAPNTTGLGLEAAGLAPGRKGEVAVDAHSQTPVPSIFAVGDVTDRVALTPVAIREGQAFADTVFGGASRTVDHDLYASAVFTRPEIGTIGLSEENAAAREPVEIYATDFRPMRQAFIDAPDRVMMKLVVSRATRRILGCHIVADNAGELIQMAAIAITMGATKEDFDRTMAVHPTISEEIVTLKTPVRTYPVQSDARTKT